MRRSPWAPAVALAFIAASCNSSSHGENGEGEAHAAAGEHTDAHGAPAHGASEHAAAGHSTPTHDVEPTHAAVNPHAISLGPPSAEAAATSHAAPHWAYNDQHAWASFSPESAACGSGVHQSPVNLEAGAPITDLPDLRTRYLPSPGAFLNNGHTLQFTPTASNARAQMLLLGRDAYNLVQFHFHSPSEHILDRRAYPLELHFVNRNSAGQLAVVGVFIEEGPENPALAGLLANAPHAEGDETAIAAAVDLNALLPSDRAYFAYAGSLTTPPCTEGVRWNVLRTPITASAEQIAQMREALGASSRHVQSLNGRTVALGL